MKKIFYYCIFIYLMILAISCENNLNTSPKMEIDIITPLQDWIYYVDSLITFSTNVKSAEILWSSSRDGFLGKGATINRYLSPGEHIIKAELASLSQSVYIIVNERNTDSGESLMFLLNKKNKHIYINEGVYNPCLLTFEKGLDKFLFSDISQIEFKKDFSIKQSLYPKIINKDKSRSISNIKQYTEETKKFYVVNTRNQTMPPHSFESKIIKNTDKYLIWYPTVTNDYFDIDFDEEYFEYCLNIIDEIILPRVYDIWGDVPDIDNDEKIAFFISPSINQEETSVGFFNSNDFFQKDENNIFSNEMDIIYLAVPQKDSFSYSAECIAATVAHELTHLINFYNKTYVHLQESDYNASCEEIFLDEALSHLTETLCGFSVSGGNISNLALYLNNTDIYSFCDIDRYGQGDSNGQRGAMTLFLSWLFWKKGGMKWDALNPKRIIDTGGISFLREIVNQYTVGWNSIGKAYGNNTDELWIQMIKEINANRANRYSPIIDPITEEPVQLFINMGFFRIEELDKEWMINLPKIGKFSELESLPKYSFILLNNLNSTGSSFCIENSIISGRTMLLLCKE